MVDRQDIDALLIGSLYGELSSAEEARLTAHLESHPTDRTALANLSRARDVVRESRILQVQFDPPQSISALLMQEAARRAPKSREEAGWFQRFMRSFMTHPAMAAAAMLVLIVGVAGTVYMRQGDHFAKQTTEDSSAADRGGLAAPATTATPSTEQQPAELARQAGSAASDDYRVGLNDDGNEPADKVVTGSDAPARPADGTVVDAKKNRKGGDAFAFGESDRSRDESALAKREADDRVATLDQAEPKPATKTPATKTATKPAKSTPRLDVSTPAQGPKDFESTATKRSFDDGKPSEPSVATGGVGGASAPRSPGVAAPKPDNAAPAPSPPPPPPPASIALEEKQEKEKADPLIAWAKERHGKVVAAVRAGNCQNAANLAVEISNRAPAYYTSNVENDRTLKQCMQYITAQREKDAERVQRAKATQRRATDEAPAPSKK